SDYFVSNDPPRNLVQCSLNGLRHQLPPRDESVFESGPMKTYPGSEGISINVEYFRPELERMLCLRRTLSTAIVPKLSSLRCSRKLAISSLFRPDRTRAIVM